MTSGTPATLPDSPARIRALTEHDRSLLVEAGAGSGKTALMAGRVALMIAAGIAPRGIVAITFTEAAAAELLERIERFVTALQAGDVPVELRAALPGGLGEDERRQLRDGAAALDEITCTTIHGFCQQLLKPYPVETGQDPGASIIDPAAAMLAYKDLLDTWLSARFGRDRGAEGLGRLPPLPAGSGEGDFFVELLSRDPDKTLNLIQTTAAFLKHHRTAGPVDEDFDPTRVQELAETVERCSQWYKDLQVQEGSTGEFIEDMQRVVNLLQTAAQKPLDGANTVELLFALFDNPPAACKKGDAAFKQWGRKTKWKNAARQAGLTAADGEQLSSEGEALYQACGQTYEELCGALGSLLCRFFLDEFEALKGHYADYKRNAALLDFDDLLYQARDLLRTCVPVRQALTARYPHILVDEFQDTDPIQAEILWYLAGDGEEGAAWHERRIRPGALVLVGDPKQAIYRFRGADIDVYLQAKRALAAQDPEAILAISTCFRARPDILDFVNRNFARKLDEANGQPGFAPLSAIRPTGDEASVAVFDILLEEKHKNDNGRLVADTIRKEEAGHVSNIIQRLIGAYPIWDADMASYRPATASDIAILAPTGSSLWIYERELEAAGVPIATQAGKGFFRRQEVKDLIALARAIADSRDTLALGALLRGPLMGLTEEEIADEIHALKQENHKARLTLWTDIETIGHPLLKETLRILQNLGKKARRAMPYQLMAEAIEEMHVRPILKARHPRGAERALANVELVLEMARAYDGRGIADFAMAMRQNWQEAESQQEGRPDAEAEAVSIMTIHSAKGLEWPIVIPINSMTRPTGESGCLYRRKDDTAHLKVLGFPNSHYEQVKEAENQELDRERLRLWYVALTRAKDLLLLPRQSERSDGDWFSIVDPDLDNLPVLDIEKYDGTPREPRLESDNKQEAATWRREADAIAAAGRAITWHQPSRHEAALQPEAQSEAVFTSIEEVTAVRPQAPAEGTGEDESGNGGDGNKADAQGSRERGLILHQLMEEVLTGEVEDKQPALAARAKALIGQLGQEDQEAPSAGLASVEIAATVVRTLHLPAIAELRPAMRAEYSLYTNASEGGHLHLTAGIADAVVLDASGQIATVIDWKSDVAPRQSMIEQYREQVKDYLAATGAEQGLLVFMSTGAVEKVPAIPR